MNYTIMKNVFPAQDRFVFLGITLFFIVCLGFSVFFEGTVDSGDSIMHYLYSKYSFTHTSLYYHHWAKPVFVLLSSPFSQFGIIGIKIFNSIVTSLSLLFTYFVAKKITKHHSSLSVIFLCFAPLYFIITFSGLTEPLFAFFLIFSIYLLISEKVIASLVLISFLPFVRSEGLILIGIYAFYLIVTKKYKLLPLLAIGHIIYSIAGYFTYHNFLWVFTQIPYARLSSTYGSGRIFHFVNQMTYVIGIPLYILLLLGIIYLITTFFSRFLRKEESNYSFKLIIVYVGFFAFFVAHSLFWYLGIFNSMGLKRVLICVVPLISLISLDGFNFVTKTLIKNRTFSRIAGFVLLGYVIIFPFTRNPAAIKWKKEFSLSDDQVLIKEMSTFIKKNYSGSVYYYYPPYISVQLGIDPFDNNCKKGLPELYNNTEIPANALIIWDNWCAVIENGISLESLQKDERLVEVKVFETPKSKFVIFKYNGSK